VKREGSREEVEFARSDEVRAKGSRERWHGRETMIVVHVKLVTMSGMSEDECRDAGRLRQAR
jgi:hypothetical protein